VAVPEELAQPLREVISGAIAMVIVEMVAPLNRGEHNEALAALAARRQALEGLLDQFHFDADRAPVRIEIDLDRHGPLMIEILAPIVGPAVGRPQAPTGTRLRSQRASRVPVRALRDFMTLVERSAGPAHSVGPETDHT
jgi:hypothetical protein